MNNKLKSVEIKYMIPDYISGTLNETDKSLVEDSIRNSSEISEYYNEMRETIEFVSSVKLDEPSDQYWNNLLPRIHEKIEERNSSGFSWDKIAIIWKVLVPVAAIILIALVYYLAKPTGVQLTDEYKNEKILNDTGGKNKTPDKVPENISTDKTDEKQNQENLVKENNINSDKTVKHHKKYLPGNNNLTAKDKENLINNEENFKNNNTVKEPENDNRLYSAELDIDEISIFAIGGESAGFDEEIDAELKKLDDSDQNLFLLELQNSNL